MSVKKSAMYVDAAKISEMMNVSMSCAHKLVARLNKELESAGKVTRTGKVPKSYLTERIS
ncbi:MAG: transcriptional regulator [Lachnospiraceae bacterium]|nr:transcriptional regulator [Lachnospiraceae bacterium]